MKKGKFDKPKALVTGGAGFWEAIFASGRYVMILKFFAWIIFFTGQKRNIIHLLQNPWFSLIHHDICLPYSIDIDFIFNFACPASPPYYQFDPVKTINTNVLEQRKPYINLAKEKLGWEPKIQLDEGQTIGYFKALEMQQG